MTEELSTPSAPATQPEAKALHLLALAHLLEEQRSSGHTPRHIHNLIGLIEEGATVPFIARYRKEMTGAMDEVAIATLKDRYEELCQLEARKQTILTTIQQQGKLTAPLEQQIAQCRDRHVLEDLYLPYKPKRKTKASVARERGLEPLASEIFAARGRAFELNARAADFVNAELGVANIEEALAGAAHIVAEWVSETVEVRAELRHHLATAGEVVVAKAPREKADEPTKFEMYYDFREPARTMPSHRYLAIRRGEEEGILRFTIEGDRVQMMLVLAERFITARSGESADFLRACLVDALDRLLLPSLITEVRLELKRRAEAEAIAVFAQNLRPVLLSPPAGERRVIGIDPGYRTGCKIAAIDETGKLLAHATVFPHAPHNQIAETKKLLSDWCQEHNINALAVGNGTASRETMQLAQEVAEAAGITAALVSEAGASVYSASEIARAEFPDLDLTVRSAVSIARRFQDPLAELVKIDPKSIGVGQYQHDVEQSALKKSLDGVVESCVNFVGIDLNTASETLLKYVSGIGAAVAKEIVHYRDDHGRFQRREELLSVPRVGAKTFEQAAGFLRIRAGLNPLDNTAVHPESYLLVEKMATSLGLSTADLVGNQSMLERLRIEEFVNEQAGLLTLNDIAAELARPGRDPRSEFEPVCFAEGVNSLEDLEVDMVLEGVVTNVTNFGAFVDIGVHQDGLVHISQLSHRFVKVPTEVIKVGDKVKVKVIDVDLTRRRIGLSIKEALPMPPRPEKRPPESAQKPLARAASSSEQTGKANKAANARATTPASQPAAGSANKPPARPAKAPPPVKEDTSSLAEKLANAWARNRLK
jgi:uncharacterized protein